NLCQCSVAGGVEGLELVDRRREKRVLAGVAVDPRRSPPIPVHGVGGDSLEGDLEESARSPRRCCRVGRRIWKEIQTGPEAMEVVRVKGRAVNGVVEEKATGRDLGVEHGLALRVLR